MTTDSGWIPLLPQQRAYLAAADGGYELSGFGMDAHAEFRGRADPDRLAAAARRVLTTQGMTTVEIDPVGVRQRLVAASGDCVAVVDLPATTEAGPLEDAVRAVRGRRIRRGHPVSDHTRMSVVIGRCGGATAGPGETDVVVFVGMDGTALDLHSWYLLLDRIAEVYRGGDTTPSGGFVDWFHETGVPTPRAKDVEYWAGKAPLLPPGPVLPLLGEPGGIDPPVFTAVEETIPASVFEQVCECARVHRVLPGTLFVGAVAEVLGSLGAVRPFTLTVPTTRRAGRAAGGVVGPLSDFTLVVAPTGRTVADRMAGLQRDLLGAVLHGSVDGPSLVREVGRHRGEPGRVHAPVVVTSAADARSPGGVAFFGTDLVRTYELSRTPQIALDVKLVPDGDGLAVQAHGVRGLLPPGVLENLPGAVVDVLEALRGSWDVGSVALRPVEDRVVGAARDRAPGRTGEPAAADPSRPGVDPLTELVREVGRSLLGHPWGDEGFYSAGGRVGQALRLGEELAEALLEKSPVRLPALFDDTPPRGIAACLRRGEGRAGRRDRVAQLTLDLDR